MKIVVCVKRVPDTEARIRVAGDGRSADPTGVKFIANPYDEFAVEAALRFREAAGEGEVVALSVGGSESAETLRTILARAADVTPPATVVVGEVVGVRGQVLALLERAGAGFAKAG